jgi:hypothetical protein
MKKIDLFNDNLKRNQIKTKIQELRESSRLHIEERRRDDWLDPSPLFKHNKQKEKKD